MKNEKLQIPAFLLLLVVGIATYGVGLSVIAALTVLVVPERVGYRRRDAFMIFIPIWNWVWGIMMMWRLTHLQHPFWSMPYDDYALLDGQYPQRTAPDGWYADPTGRHEERYWAGEWSEHVSDGGVPATDPLAAV